MSHFQFSLCLLVLKKGLSYIIRGFPGGSAGKNFIILFLTFYNLSII